MGQDPFTHGKLVGEHSAGEFLTVLGADVNAIDTSVAKTTPLIEAARAGKREACEVQSNMEQMSALRMPKTLLFIGQPEEAGARC